MEDRNGSTQRSTEAELQSLGVVLRITHRAWEKLMAYCRATNNEVSGFMLIERDGLEIRVTDCYIVEQESTPTSTEMKSTAIAKLMGELLKKGILGKKENVKLGHFHTHPTFNVFWSGTDMEMRATLRRGTDYYVSLVINQKGEALAALDINGDFPMSISNLDIELLPSEQDASLVETCKKEVAEKIKSWSFQDTYAQYDRSYQGRGGRHRVMSVGPDGVVEPEEQLLLGGPKARAMVDDDCPDWVRALAEGESINTDEGTFANIGGEIVRVKES
jgi:proteasome lid subunit RPN8/RPN11